MLDLSREHDPAFLPSTMNVMREGRIFESMVLGIKDQDEYKKDIKGKRKETLQRINDMASTVKTIFRKGDSYVGIMHEFEDYTLAGEADFIGEIHYVDPFGEVVHYDECIADLKKTGDINRVWDFKNKKEDYLQAIMYPYIVWKSTGKLLPFVYIVVEDTFDEPIIRCIPVSITEKDFTDFLEPFIKRVHYSQHTPADQKSCLGRHKGEGRCWYLKYCKYGRNNIGGAELVDFSKLNTELE